MDTSVRESDHLQARKRVRHNTEEDTDRESDDSISESFDCVGRGKPLFYSCGEEGTQNKENYRNLLAAGDADGIKRKLENSTPSETSPAKGAPPPMSLSEAVKTRNIRMVKRCLDHMFPSGHKARSREDQYERNSLLLDACHNGDNSIVELLLQFGFDIERSRSTIQSALNIAITKGYIKIVGMLISKGADIENKDHGNRTALMHAVMIDQTAIVKLLIGSNANMEAVDFETKTALMLAAERGFVSSMETLLKHGADVNAITSVSKYNALMLACEHGKSKVINALIKGGIDVNAKSCNNKTALTIACDVGYIPVVEELLTKKQTLSYSYGKSAAIAACEHGFAAIVLLLIQKGVSVDTVDNNNKSLLSIACENGQIVTAKLLLALEANTEMRNVNQMTALMMACSKGNYQLVQELLEHNAYVDALDLANKSALLYAISSGKVNIVSMLLDYGADVNHRSMSESVLQCACRLGHVDIVQELIHRKCDVNAANSRGHNALMIASSLGNCEIIRLLLASGSNLDATDSCRYTALTHAVRAGQVTAVKYLLQQGANIDILNKSSQTLIQFAISVGSRQVTRKVAPDKILGVVSTLLSYGAKWDHDDAFINDILVRLDAELREALLIARRDAFPTLK